MNFANCLLPTVLFRHHFFYDSFNIFRNFERDGVWGAIWESLHMDLRESLGRQASPTAAVIDSQSLKSAEKGAVTMAL